MSISPDLLDYPPRAHVGTRVLPAVLALAVTALGMGLRIEHALTFDGPNRGSDYAVYVDGVRWTIEHHAPFHYDPSANYQVRYQPPLWFALSAVILWLTDSERAIAVLAIFGFLLRQIVLAQLLSEAVPRSRWSQLAALSLHSVLPIGVLMDGKVNPEGLQSGLFMLALFFLWRMEREDRIRTRTAILFGLFAGLALLTKATSSVLLMTALGVFALRADKRRFFRPLASSLAVWTLVAGWWCAPNVLRFGHPFPHPWDLEGPAEHSELAKPLLYRRPIGWALPFQLVDYLQFPIIGDHNLPTPNFWAYTVLGTWTDLYNRGFCRLEGGEKTNRVWGGTQWGLNWTVTQRCVDVSSGLAGIGLLLSIAVGFSVVWILRSRGPEHSQVLPVAAGLVVLFVFLFALKYPFDGMAVLNPKYLLSAMAPMAACFGLWLAHFREGSRGWRVAHRLSFTAIALVGSLVLLERFAR